MSKPVRPFSVRRLRKTVSHKGRDVLVIHVRIPVFEPIENSPQEEKFILTVNRFYEKCAARYAANAERKAKRARAVCEKTGVPALSAVMRPLVTYADERILSVCLDVGSFDGHTMKTVRFSQIWDRESASLLAPSDLFRLSRAHKAHLRSCVLDAAREASEKGAFTGYGDYEKRLVRRFSAENVCILPHGIGFFYPGGELCADGDLIPLFVVPCEKIDGVLKITFRRHVLTDC